MVFMDKQDLENFIKIGIDVSEVSKISGLSKSQIYYRMKKWRIDPHFKFICPKKEDLIREYVWCNNTLLETAANLKISESSVIKLLKKFGIPLRGSGRNQFDVVDYELVKNEFSRNGHILLSKSYENANIKLDYICRCGNKSSMTFAVCRRGTGCIKCGALLRAERRKEPLEDVKKYVESKGCSLIEKFIHKQKTRIKYICYCGSPHEMYMSNFKKGYPCKECKRRKFLGEKNSNFNPNLSEYDRLEIGRYEEGYGSWRKSVYRKYGYKCDICNKDSNNDLIAHHLEGYSENPKLRTEVSNGVCLCLRCHKKFHARYGYGNNTSKQYYEFKMTESREVPLGSLNFRP